MSPMGGAGTLAQTLCDNTATYKESALIRVTPNQQNIGAKTVYGYHPRVSELNHCTQCEGSVNDSAQRIKCFLAHYEPNRFFTNLKMQMTAIIKENSDQPHSFIFYDVAKKLRSERKVSVSAKYKSKFT